MQYRKLKKSGEELSILGFGCMRLPVIDNVPSQIDEEKAIAMVRHAIDEGVNYVDTAFPYHGDGIGGAGMSEPFLAKALKDGYREKVNIATKLPVWLANSREDMDNLLTQQLERLETDCIDFYLLHALNRGMWLRVKELGFDDFLDNAIKDGRIRHAGFSYHDRSAELFRDIVDGYDWSFCQIQYNYMDTDEQAGKEGLDYAASKGLGVIIMEPLRGGSLSKDLPGEVEEVFNKIYPGRTPTDWALRWVWNHEAVTVALSGMTTMSQVKENLKTAEDSKANALTQDELNAVEEAVAIINKIVNVPCTGCGYCMPCPAGVNIPDCFYLYNNYFRYDQPQARHHTRFMYSNSMDPAKKANNCVECGKCEDHCPQGISIIENLKAVHETLSFS